MRGDKLDQLFKQFDMHLARIHNIVKEIEHAEKKREIEFELEGILDKLNITKATDDTGNGHREREL